MIESFASTRAIAIACAALGCSVAGCGASGDAARPAVDYAAGEVASGTTGPDAPADAPRERFAATISRPGAFDVPALGGGQHVEEPLPPPPIEAPAAPSVAALPDPTRRHRIQLGAFARGSTAASIAWESVLARHAALTGRVPLIGAARLPSGATVHRLQIAGLTENEARDLCAALAATGDGCFVVAPPHARPR